jgi:hypothetical protein
LADNCDRPQRNRRSTRFRANFSFRKIWNSSVPASGHVLRSGRNAYAEAEIDTEKTKIEQEHAFTETQSEAERNAGGKEAEKCRAIRRGKNADPVEEEKDESVAQHIDEEKRKEIPERITEEITQAFGSSSRRTAATEPDHYTRSDPPGKHSSSIRRERNSAG